MIRMALGAIVALGLAGAAQAAPFDDGPWRHVDAGGSWLWISASGGSSVHVLWTSPPQRRLPARTRYAISRYDFDCRAGGYTEEVWAFDQHHQPLEQGQETAQREVRLRSSVGALFEMVCNGAELLDDTELGSAREVLDYVASGRAERRESRPRSHWDSGLGGPDQEPLEPSGDGDR